MRAARLVVDVKNVVVWSRRPESTTKGSIEPNPKFLVHNNSVHSCVAMTEPKHAHRVVVSRAMASSLEALDIKTSPTCMHPSGNSLSSSQAMTQAPIAHGGRRIPALWDHTTQRALAKQPISSAAGDTDQDKHTSKTSGMLASWKPRRQVSGDPLRVSAQQRQILTIVIKPIITSKSITAVSKVQST